MEGDLEGGGKEISTVVGIELGKEERGGEGGGKKMLKEMRMVEAEFKGGSHF